MLTPHEFATLVLLNNTPDQVEVDCEDLEALLNQQLATVEWLGPGCSRPAVTIQGYALLKALGRTAGGSWQPRAASR